MTARASHRRPPASAPLPARFAAGGRSYGSPLLVGERNRPSASGARYWLERRGGRAGSQPDEGMEGGEAGGGGLLQQILSLRLVPRVGNGTTYSSPLSTFPGTTSPPRAPPALPGALSEGSGPGPALTAALPAEMWYGVFLWALVSSLSFHVPAALLALFTLRHHKYGRFMSVSLLLMGIVGPITAGILTSRGGRGVYGRAALGSGAARAGLKRGPGRTFPTAGPVGTQAGWMGFVDFGYNILSVAAGLGQNGWKAAQRENVWGCELKAAELSQQRAQVGVEPSDIPASDSSRAGRRDCLSIWCCWGHPSVLC